jgi:hypothetical protein
MYSIFYELLKLNEFLDIEIQKLNWKKGLNGAGPILAHDLVAPARSSG